jgi:SM-20-related protein
MYNVGEKIVDALAAEGCYVGESILGAELTSRLLSRAMNLSAEKALVAARVGRAARTSHELAIRGDATRWLDEAPDDASERDAVQAVDRLRQTLNEALFLGAQRWELHFAHYSPGACYKTHRDRFADHDARLVSLVFYLNDAWPLAAGGELLIYDEALEPLHRVQPCAGTMVAFMSERFPHEVLPASHHRFSLTGWLRRE